YSELDRLIREKDVKIEQLKQSYQELEDKWQSSNDQCFQLRQQQNEKQREYEQIIREKDTSLSTYVNYILFRTLSINDKMFVNRIFDG
ncbi:unnamed protein product, partial [Rotaria sp. Silwood1]